MNTLAQALNEASSIANVPGLLKQIIDQDMWRKRLCKQTKKPVEFRRFADFVAEHPPEGLGTNLATLRSICQHSGDMAALDALAKVETAQGYRGDLSSNTTKVDQSKGSTYTMRRLAKDVPALHAKVLAGELSPNAAAIEAGFRERKFQMPSDPRDAGRYLAERVDREWFDVLIDSYYKAIDE